MNLKTDETLFPNALKIYLRYMRTIRGRSEKTVRIYRDAINEMIRFINSHKNNISMDSPINNLDEKFFSSITLTDLYEYLYFIDMVKQNNSSTRARKVSSIRSFFKFLANKEHIISENPAAELESPKLKKSLPRYLELDESTKLLNCIEGPYKTRDFAIILLFLTCGMRLEELVNINISDIRNNVLTITGKGNKERTVYLSELCVTAIKEYLLVRPHDGVVDRDALFISRHMRRISRETVQKMVKKYIKQAGLDEKKYSVHKLRHTAATLMYRDGHVDIRLLQEILGHMNLSTTQIYTHVDNRLLKSAIDSNPISKLKREE